jgi:hypothetical protein
LGIQWVGFARGEEWLNCARKLVARYQSEPQPTTTIPKTFSFSFLSDLLLAAPFSLDSNNTGGETDLHDEQSDTQMMDVMEAQGNHDLNDEQSDEQMKDVMEEQGNHDLNSEQSDEQMKDVM